MKSICFFIFLIFICSCQQRNQKKINKSLNLSLPDFTANDILSNLTYNRKSFVNNQSKGLYLHFWATWCGPCELEFPAFIKYAKKFENRNLHFVTMAVNDRPKAIKKFLRKFGKLPKNMIILMEPNELSLRFGTSKLPETFLLDRNGAYFAKFIGPQNWGSQYYTEQLENNFLKD
ncbi:MAG: TlpA family protein disulfide reductase [Bacteriovoracaceae bacterium]|jgi:cytochrome c biogenesis protein CcmG, thiol:disulfide interchange protein DsbE|nr:TlpA family protein disulfide reductase [Bacteriovoracaceae bacterium]